MSLRRLIRNWNRFFFTPVPPTAIALYRILFGSIVIADLILLRSDWLTWYGEKGFLSVETTRQFVLGARINLFFLLPKGDLWVEVFFWFLLLFACFFTIGFITRISSVVVFLGIVSLHHRNPFILNGGDTFLRPASFFLMFAPVDAALSIDRLWRIWRGREGKDVSPQSPWAQRMIQIQLALAYLSTFCWKSQGTMWVDGTALYYISRLDEFKRFSVPYLFDNIWSIKILTWLTLLVEFSLGILVWLKELRYYVLAAGVFLHLGIEYSMNIPLFQWIFMSVYILFIRPQDLNRALEHLRVRLTTRFGAPTPVFYDGQYLSCFRYVQVMQAVDIFQRFSFIDFHSNAADEYRSGLDAKHAETELLLRTHAGCWHKGFEAFRWMAWRIPLFWVLSPILYFPGVAFVCRKIHARMLKNRGYITREA